MKSASSNTKFQNSLDRKSRLKRTLKNPSFWFVGSFLIIIGIFHYFRIYLLPPTVNAVLNRHAVDRILFLIPVFFAARSFGMKGGLLTLAIVVLVMLPRMIWVSPYHVDVLIETIAVMIVSYYSIRIIDSQMREKALRQENDARQIQTLQRLNQVIEQITAELELDRILPEVIRIAEELTGANSGGIALFDSEKKIIRHPYLHNLPEELANVFSVRGEGVVGEVIRTGQPVIVDDYQNHSSAIPNFVDVGLASVVAVPIVKGDLVFGALSLMSIGKAKHFSARDVDILKGIGRQAGVAIENARLYERTRFYIRQITQAQEEERERIARELHDETIQMLIALSRRIESLTANNEILPQATRARLVSTQEMISTILQGLRRCIQDLRPPTLDHLGLIPAIEALTIGMEEDDIRAELNSLGDVKRLALDDELILFRIVQEALNNVRRHSCASHVLVQVKFLPDGLKITIEDNGHGFDVPARMDDLVATGRLGLNGMYERARMLGGTLLIHSEPNRGTTISVEIPTTT